MFADSWAVMLTQAFYSLFSPPLFTFYSSEWFPLWFLIFFCILIPFCCCAASSLLFLSLSLSTGLLHYYWTASRLSVGLCCTSRQLSSPSYWALILWGKKQHKHEQHILVNKTNIVPSPSMPMTDCWKQCANTSDTHTNTHTKCRLLHSQQVVFL